MSVVAGSGYTLHYFDDRTGEHVSVPLEDVDVLLPSLEGKRALVTYDEVGTFTPEDLRALTPGSDDTERRVQVLEVPETLHATLDLVGFDERTLRLTFARPHLDQLYEVVHKEKRPPDWRDRGPQHKNRKKRSWRR